MDDRYAQIIKAITKAKDVAVYCHTNPDGDALSCLLAMGRALKNLGKSVSMYCDCEVPQKYKCLCGSDEITFPQKGVHELAISVDCASIDRLGQCMKSFLSSKKQIAIDHHASFARFAETCLVEANAAACAEIVYKLLKQMKAVDKDVAKLIFAGIVTDSGCFAFSSVKSSTHAVACELLEYGFDGSEVIYDVFRSCDLAKFHLKRRVFDKTRFFCDNMVAVIVFTKDDFEATHTDNSYTEGMVSELIDIREVKVAYALAEVTKHNYKLSIRTKEGVDASEIAMMMGGGGHMRAAGCRINGFLEDIIEKIVKFANDRI